MSEDQFALETKLKGIIRLFFGVYVKQLLAQLNGSPLRKESC